MASAKRIILIQWLADSVAITLAWTLFFLYRKALETQSATLSHIFTDPNYCFGVGSLLVFWSILFYHSGYYESWYFHRKGIVPLFLTTIITTALGCVIILLTVMADDLTLDYLSYVRPFIYLLTWHLALICLARLIVMISVIYLYKIHPQRATVSNVSQFRRITSAAEEIYFERLSAELLDALAVQAYRFAPSAIFKTTDSEALRHLVHSPWHYYLFGRQEVIIQIDTMPLWQRRLKRSIDIVVSILALVLLSPFMAGIALAIRAVDRGPVFYRQERLGRGKSPFRIIKFRTMVENAEAETPMLTQENDPRITAIGSILRKYRIDEWPQFWNVLQGDMSIVGPRPERPHFIAQITQHTPIYNRVFSVRPGITSWGQVRFGYASTLEEMIQRMRFDLLYLNHRSLALDFRIILHTCWVLLLGRGK